MTIPLQITLILVLLALAAALMRLFFYLGRTAQNLDVFLLAARTELSRISEDLHESRLRQDRLADSVQLSLDEFSVAAQTMGRIARAVNDLQTQFQCGLQTASRNLGSLLGLLGPVLAIFRSPGHPHGEEQRRES